MKIYLLTIFFFIGFFVFAQTPKFEGKPLDNSIINQLINYKLVNSGNPLNYDDEKEKDYGVVKINGKFGVYNLTDKSYLIKPEYDTITQAGNSLKDGKWGNLFYGDSISEQIAYRQKGIVFIRNGKQGVKDPSGFIICPAKYDKISYSGTHGLFIIENNNKWGFANAAYGTFVKPQYDYVSPYGNAIIAFRNRKKTTFAYNGGKKLKRYFVNNTDFDTRYQPDNKTLPYTFFTDKRKNGVRDLDGNIIVPPKYDNIIPLTTNNFIVTKDTLYGMVNGSGKEIIPLKYSYITPLELYYKIPDIGIYVACKNYDCGLFDENGKLIFPFDMFHGPTYIYSENEKLRLDTQYLTYTENSNLPKAKQNEFTDEWEYPKSEDYTSALLKIEKGKATKYAGNLTQNSGALDQHYDKKPNDIIAIQDRTNLLYNFICMYKPKETGFKYKKFKGLPNNRVLVQKGEFYDTFLDTLLNESATIAPIYDYKDGYYLIQKNNRMGVMDSHMSISPFEYPKIEYLNNGRYWPRGIPDEEYSLQLFKFYPDTDSKKIGVIDSKGNIIFPAGKYDEISLQLTQNGAPEKFSRNKVLWDNYLDKIIVCKKFVRDYIKVDLYANEKKIASFNSGLHWYFDYDSITENQSIIIHKTDSILVIDLKTQTQIIGIPREKSIRGFFISNDGTYIHSYSKNNKLFADIYSDKGKLLTKENIPYDNVYLFKSLKTEYIKQEGKKYGTIDAKSQTLAPFEYDTIYSYDFTNYVAGRNSKFGIIRQGKIVAPILYDTIIFKENTYNNKNFYILKSNKKYGLMSSDKRDSRDIKNSEPVKLMDTIYDNLVTGGAYIFTRKGKTWSAFSISSKYSLSIDCDTIVEKDLIYTKGKLKGVAYMNGKIEGDYDDIKKVGNFFITEKNGKHYILDSNGNLFFPFAVKDMQQISSYDEISDIWQYFYVVTNEQGKKALYDDKGTNILPFEYDDLEVENLKYVIAKKDGHIGAVNLKNEILIPFKYENINFREAGLYFEAKNEADDRYKIAPNGIILEETLKEKDE
jgi:hypothetical protein